MVSNNYSLTLASRRASSQQYPRQHLYGVDYLEAAGHDVRCVDPSEHQWLTRAGRRGRGRWGDLGQEVAIWRAMSDASVCYAAEPWHVGGASRLRGRGRWPAPMIAVLHQPPRGSSAVELVRGFDVTLCLSRKTAEQAVAAGRDPGRTMTLPWGPDVSMAGYESTGSEFVLSSGKTNRDLRTLLSASSGLDVPVRVYSLEPLDGVPGNVEVVTTDRHEDLGGGSSPQFAFETVLRDTCRAAVVAIPLADPDRLSGLTEINDALALGKPILMTRTPYIDVDIEEIGCGRWIAPGDVAGWRSALCELWEDASLRASMGAAGRRFAEQSWNCDLFGAGVVAAVEAAAS